MDERSKVETVDAAINLVPNGSIAAGVLYTVRRSIINFPHIDVALMLYREAHRVTDDHAFILRSVAEDIGA